MTSHEWQEGHKYGTHTKPRYNAISYTWGRYELRSPDEQPHVKAINISGVTWTIPRIDETHFTVAQYEALIRRSTERTVVKGYNPAFSTAKTTEFVWLDIACINQTPNHPQKAQEIGRQAQIFKKATKVLVWLNGSSREGIKNVIENIAQAAAIAGRDVSNITPGKHRWKSIPGSGSVPWLEKYKRWLASRAARLQSNMRHFLTPFATDFSSALTGQEQWLTVAIENVKFLTEDRWFSSLWTLQEAFLCQWAYLVSEEVETIHQDSPQLRSCFSPCATLSRLCRRSIATKKNFGLPITSTELELIDLLERTGLAALEAENPMALYTVASKRVTMRSEDRIYGIMQVFDFQLGISDPDAPTDSVPADLPKLELQLGQQLIKRYPLMSQLHVHTQPVGLGHAWRVSNSSRIPALVSKVDFRIVRSTMGQHTSLSDLSYEDIDGTCWGSFSGKVSAFDRIQRAWYSADNRLGRGKKGRSIQQLALDSTDFIPKQTFPEEVMPSNECQHGLAAEMTDYFRSARLSAVILLLGRFSDDQHSDEWWEFTGGPIVDMTGDRFLIGMILVQQENCRRRIWRRLGICIWDLRRPKTGESWPENDLLEGESTEWIHHEGIYG
ncbi:MAG: hypothetical protein Q9223_002692 [Gallowayella weberi]